MKSIDGIPDFLRISAEDRKAAWVGRPLTNPRALKTPEEIEKEERDRAAFRVAPVGIDINANDDT